MDLSIAAITVSPTSTGAVEPDGQRPGPFRAAMDAAARALGMNPQDLRTALQNGQSLADVAQSKGISQDQLVSAMSSAITGANPGVGADQANQIAQRIVTQVPGQGGEVRAAGPTGAPHGHHHRHHGGGDLLDAVSSTLGQSTSSLVAALQGGQSLASIGAASGVSQDQLVGSVVTALQGDNPNLTLDQATQLATEFVTAAGQSSQVNVSA